MRRIAVLGATGMAGHVIAQHLQERGHEVYRMSRSVEKAPRNAAIDARDSEAVIAWLDSIGPDAVVNAIGVLPAEADRRPDIAVLLNAYLPHRLATYYQGQSTRIIHLSTDCVYSGTSGGYRETSLPDGMSIYDRSKAMGELVNTKDLTFRMSIIGPDISESGVGLFNWFMKQSGQVNGYSQVMWNGITTIELARAIDAALEQGVAGLYHLVPDCGIDKLSLLKLFREVFEKYDVEIIPYERVVSDKTLVNTRSDFHFVIPNYGTMVEDMRIWVYAHRDMYHY